MRKFIESWHAFWDKVHAFWGNLHLYAIIVLLIYWLIGAKSDVSFYKNEVVDTSIAQYNDLYYAYEKLYKRCDNLVDEYAFLENEDLFIKIEEPDYYKNTLEEIISYLENQRLEQKLND